jgi:hypothetical protein
MKRVARHLLRPARHPVAYPIIALLIILGLAALPALAGPQRRPRIYEHGFRVDRVEGCGTLGVKRLIRNTNPDYIPHSVQDIKCSPGGSWGDNVYLLVTEDIASGGWVDVERVTFQGDSELFTSTEPRATGLQLSIAPPGWSGGEILFANVGDMVSSLIYWIQPTGVHDARTIPLLGTLPRLGPVAVDGSGDFGGELYYASSGQIVRVDASGMESLFATPPSVGAEMRFGPGGDWGTDLYTGGSVISRDGTVTPFPASFGEFDWVFGSAFNGDMFELLQGDPSTIDRIQPDGTRSRFATAGASSQIAACNGALWIAGPGEGCFVVTPRGGQKNRKLVLR